MPLKKSRIFLSPQPNRAPACAGALWHVVLYFIHRFNRSRPGPKSLIRGLPCYCSPWVPTPWWLKVQSGYCCTGTLWAPSPLRGRIHRPVRLSPLRPDKPPCWKTWACRCRAVTVWFRLPGMRWSRLPDSCRFLRRDMRWFRLPDTRWFHRRDTRWFRLPDTRWFHRQDMCRFRLPGSCRFLRRGMSRFRPDTADLRPPAGRSHCRIRLFPAPGRPGIPRR